MKSILKFLKEKKIYVIGFFLFAGVFGSWLFYRNWIMSEFPNAEDWAKRGQFGDMFGAINALFTGLAFAGLIVTIMML